MEKQDIIKNLQGIVGADQVLSDEESVLGAAKDYIGFRVYQRADGKNFAPRAACVVKVKSTEEASKVLKFLNDNEVDVVPRTGGSSVTMGVEPQPGGVIIDGSLMNKIIDLNETNMTVTVACGTPLEYLENYLNERGYTAGHFPQSLPMASIGGLVATRSIGQFSTLYGGIEDLVVGLEAVLADGEVIRIKNVPRRSCGPDLRHLFIGNEGMLGFVTEVTMKLFKYRPDERWMCAYGIKDMLTGFDMLHDIMKDGYRPAVARLHDAAEALMILGMHDVGLPAGYGIMLFLCEGPKPIADATGAAIQHYAEKYEAVSLGDKPVRSWLKTRNDVCSQMDNGQYYKMGAVADTCEISGNWDVIGKIYEGVTTRLPEENEQLMYVGGHSSHSYMQGTNIYFTFGFMEDHAETAQEDYMKVISVIMEETLKYGGSIAHHHGSGKYRTAWMPQEHGSSYPLMYKLKDALDPKHILNKGVLLVDNK